MRTTLTVALALVFSAAIAAIASGLIDVPDKHLPALLLGFVGGLVALAMVIGVKLDDLDPSLDDDIDDCPPCNSACGQGRKCPANARSGCAKNDADLDNLAGEIFAHSTSAHIIHHNFDRGGK